jgi:hypothetical protein
MPRCARAGFAPGPTRHLGAFAIGLGVGPGYLGWMLVVGTWTSRSYLLLTWPVLFLERGSLIRSTQRVHSKVFFHPCLFVLRTMPKYVCLCFVLKPRMCVQPKWVFSSVHPVKINLVIYSSVYPRCICTWLKDEGREKMSLPSLISWEACERDLLLAQMPKRRFCVFQCKNTNRPCINGFFFSYFKIGLG